MPHQLRLETAGGERNLRLNVASRLEQPGWTRQCNAGSRPPQSAVSHTPSRCLDDAGAKAE